MDLDKALMRKVLRKAKKLMVGKGWTKTAWGVDSAGDPLGSTELGGGTAVLQFCLEGAILRSAALLIPEIVQDNGLINVFDQRVDHVRALVAKVIVDLYGPEYDEGDEISMTITNFNDQPDTTKRMINKVVEESIRRLEDQADQADKDKEIQKLILEVEELLADGKQPDKLAVKSQELNDKLGVPSKRVKRIMARR